MRILAQPFLKGNNNPYTYRLYSSVEQLGHSVDHTTLKTLLKGKYDIWHRHWPEITLSDKNLPRAILKTLVFLFFMDVLRLKGAKNIWTIHNLETHEKLYPRLEKLFWKLFIPRLDGYISLSEAGQVGALKKFPKLKNVPGFIVPHAHYRGEYPDTITRQEARERLGVEPHHKVFLMLGNLRPYKNALALIRMFKSLPDPNYRLFIGGKAFFPELRNEIQQAAANDPRISLYLDYVPVEDVQVYLRAADLMVLPYTEILNSGSALLSLSFDCPVLVTRKGAMAELQNSVGKEWVHTFEGELTTSVLEGGMRWALMTRRLTSAPLHGLEDEAIAQKTVDAYEYIRLGRKPKFDRVAAPARALAQEKSAPDRSAEADHVLPRS